MTGRREKELNDAINYVGHGERGVAGDVLNLADLDKLLAMVKAEVGSIDVLVANASGGEFAPIADVTEEHYSRTFDTNVKGYWLRLRPLTSRQQFTSIC